ncbi:DUF1329 domain-containing protein [uncultured Nevskia sp.]|uniref:DUF1329 domain-containing protein n=1 Tax=uncultured Nevskia sp. TaxID=228950 RepID=UPI0025D32A20|nr:DUF1329 domain-containing protein [uncultured Nevskia sp.]
MRITRYDGGYSRRKFLADASRGTLATGVLMPLSQAIAQHGDISKAYPDELLSIEGYTKGRIKTGDEITAANVELVKDLIEPIRYEQILKQGRKLRVVKTTTDVMRTSPWEYLEATLRNAGKAKFDARGNVVNTADGKPWIGGNPFPDPKTAEELFAAQTLSWGRHDASFYAIKIKNVGSDGRVGFEYECGWSELSAVSRVSMDPKPYWPEHLDKLRYQSVFFTKPGVYRGTSFLNIWDYDQSTFPVLYGYVPEFRRIRQFPTNQRFEPLVPGLTLFLSDVWGAGDPMYTWGNYKIVHRGPFLGGVSGGWSADHPNWEHKTHGGPKGLSFWDTDVELVPEIIVVEAEPTKFPRAPVSKKRVWFDARNQTFAGMTTYDRNGLPYRSFDGCYGLYESGDKKVMDGKHPYWSWGHLTCSDIQTGSITRLEQVKAIEGVHLSGANDPRMYDRYLTQAALIGLGSS